MVNGKLSKFTGANARQRMPTSGIAVWCAPYLINGSILSAVSVSIARAIRISRRNRFLFEISDFWERRDSFCDNYAPVRFSRARRVVGENNRAEMSRLSAKINFRCCEE